MPIMIEPTSDDPHAGVAFIRFLFARLEGDDRLYVAFVVLSITAEIGGSELADPREVCARAREELVRDFTFILGKRNRLKKIVPLGRIRSCCSCCVDNLYFTVEHGLLRATVKARRELGEGANLETATAAWSPMPTPVSS